MMKVGMVGVGCISGIYLKNFKETFKNVELVAVCDLIRERAEKAQKEYGVPTEACYATGMEMLSQPKLADFVIIAIQDQDHSQYDSTDQQLAPCAFNDTNDQ